MTALIYYMATTAADTNSGTSEGDAPVVNGTAATRSTNVYTLDGSPDLSSLTANVDAIHIVGETSGRGNDGTLFEITAIDDGADTVTVSPTPSGATSSITWAIGGAFATIDKGMQVVEPGDLGHPKATAAYTENATIVTIGTAGTGWIVFEGYTTTPGDGGQVTMDGSGLTNCLTQSASSADLYYSIRNFICDGCDAEGIDLNDGDNITFINVTASNNTGSGLVADDNCCFYKDLFDGNGDHGLDCDFDSLIACCEFTGNTNIACETFNDVIHYQNLFHDGAAGQQGIRTQSSGILAVLQCTLDGEGLTGGSHIGVNQTGANNSSTTVIMNSIIYDWTVGVDFSSGQENNTHGKSMSYGNLMNSNTTDRTFGEVGYSGTGWSTTAKGADITGAPAFTNEAGDDYTLGDASPALVAGIGGGPSVSATAYVDVGAFQKEPAAGGSASGVRNPLRGPVG